jgi:ABC-type sugar transport system substrate-binding protein
VLRLLADENFNGRILRALIRQNPDLDVVRAQDTPLSGADDPTLLEFAAAEGRILLTHDIETLVGYAWKRVRSGIAMPGVIVVLTDRPIGQVLEDLETLLLASRPEELVAQIYFLPF